MNICTSLEQSRKLAEFLPLESADMRYHTISHYNPYSCNEIVYTIDFGKTSGKDVPCWSLTALLAQMPGVELTSNKDNHYGVSWRYMYSDWYDNPIDACVELIERVRKEEKQ